jgi:hypothetical protein
MATIGASGHGSVVECLSSMCKALGSIPHTTHTHTHTHTHTPHWNSVGFFVALVCGAGDGPQDPTHARQKPYYTLIPHNVWLSSTHSLWYV